MTSGIYALYWENDDSIYVGQAQDFSNREKEHLRDLRNISHSNYKVQQKYNEFGIPQFILLDHCSIQELNEREIFWQKEFNSLESLDIVYAGQVGYGAFGNASKYSKLQILKVFSLLYKGILSIKEIAHRLRVNVSLPVHISKGENHLWLKERYPEKYQLMITSRRKGPTNNGSLLKYRGKSIPDLKSPDGVIYSGIENITDFCRSIPGFRENLINSSRGLTKLIAGSRSQYKGWTLI